MHTHPSAIPIMPRVDLLLASAALLVSCDALLVPTPAARATATVQRPTARMHRPRPPLFMSDAAGEEEPPPAAEKKASGRQSDMPTNFLGFIDVTTTGGSLAASLIVAGGFGLFVEFVKFLDPNSASPSVFGSLWS